MSRNDDVADQLEAFADLLEAKGVEYKPTAYRRAAENVREYPDPIGSLAAEGPGAVAEIDRVGDAIAGKIVEYVETGSIEELAELRAELPVDMAALTRVEGVGPKTVGALYDGLGVEDLDDLERAARNEEIREVSGFGATTEQNILDNVAFARRAGDRELLGEARPVGESLRDRIAAVDGVERAALAGSLRRWKETIGDVDVLAAAADGDTVTDAFVALPPVDDVIEAGATKASVRSDGIRVDLRVVAPEEFGAALQYFTGSRAHNVALRNRAIDRGLKLNEYGVFTVDDADEAGAGGDDGEGGPNDHDARGEPTGERIAGETESGVYDALSLPPIPPELRGGDGEVAAAADGALPSLIGAEALRGDLHTHTVWSDGGNTIEEMVAAAAERGYDYHVVADHADGPGTFGNVGLSEADLRDQADAVAAVDETAAIDVLHGVEANIAADGSIPTDDDLLEELDLVVASPHAALGQGRKPATERLVAAVEHPAVDVLGHPTGRQINERAGLEVDVERVAAAAADAGTALEINANPRRLDLSGADARAAIEAGATLAVNTDAHAPAGLDNARYGLHTARRGWASEADVLNTRGVESLRSFCE